MNDINELKSRVNSKTLHVWMLTLATAGIYIIMWLQKNNAIIKDVTKKNVISDSFIIWYAALLGYGMVLTGYKDTVAIALLATTSTLGASVLLIIWAFKARSALQQYALENFKLDLKMNAFYTFLFNILYVNYCINALEEDKKKQDILFSRIQP